MVNQDLRFYQKQWAYQKYWVMAHSQRHYEELRRLFKGNDWTAEKAARFEEAIAEAEAIVPTIKTLRTAYQHVWGYFKKVATPAEKDRFRYLDAFLASKSEDMQLFLEEMTQRYQPAYLISCRLMTKGI